MSKQTNNNATLCKIKNKYTIQNDKTGNKDKDKVLRRLLQVSKKGI